MKKVLVSNLAPSRCCGSTMLVIRDNGNGTFGGECGGCRCYCTNAHTTLGGVLDEWLDTKKYRYVWGDGRTPGNFNDD